MEVLFWFFIILIVYCYFGYPLAIYLLASINEKRVKKSSIEPSVSIVLSVYNEEDVIVPKIENLLSLDYPKEKIEIIIGSDGSTDKTNELIEAIDDSRVHLVKDDRRHGKMVTLNQLVPKAKYDILLFTDARQLFDKNALKVLVSNLADPSVGCVSGELVFSKKEGATARGVNLYWSYEKFIRLYEAKWHSMLGATGAIYVLRKELYTPIPESVVLDDMYVPLKIIQQGYRAYFDDNARAYDEVADSPKEEYRRKARTLYGNYQIFGLFKGMFVPGLSPVAVQLFSHKFLRVVMPYCLIFVFLLNLALLNEEFYQIILFLQFLFYLMAFVGALARYQTYGILKFIAKLCYVPYVFCLLNFSALVGLLRFLLQKQEVKWEKARS